MMSMASWRRTKINCIKISSAFFSTGRKIRPMFGKFRVGVPTVGCPSVHFASSDPQIIVSPHSIVQGLGRKMKNTHAYFFTSNHGNFFHYLVTQPNGFDWDFSTECLCFRRNRQFSLPPDFELTVFIFNFQWSKSFTRNVARGSRSHHSGRVFCGKLFQDIGHLIVMRELRVRVQKDEEKWRRKHVSSYECARQFNYMIHDDMSEN